METEFQICDVLSYNYLPSLEVKRDYTQAEIIEGMILACISLIQIDNL